MHGAQRETVFNSFAVHILGELTNLPLGSASSESRHIVMRHRQQFGFWFRTQKENCFFQQFKNCGLFILQIYAKRCHLVPGFGFEDL